MWGKKLLPLHFCDMPPYRHDFKTTSYKHKNVLAVIKRFFKIWLFPLPVFNYTVKVYVIVHVAA